MNFREALRALIRAHTDEGWPTIAHELEEAANWAGGMQRKEIVGDDLTIAEDDDN